MVNNDIVKRLEDLEVKFAFQSEMLEELNKTVTDQWEEIERQKTLIKILKDQIEDIRENKGEGPENSPPPHY